MTTEEKSAEILELAVSLLESGTMLTIGTAMEKSRDRVCDMDWGNRSEPRDAPSIRMATRAAHAVLRRRFPAGSGLVGARFHNSLLHLEDLQGGAKGARHPATVYHLLRDDLELWGRDMTRNGRECAGLLRDAAMDLRRSDR